MDFIHPDNAEKLFDFVYLSFFKFKMQKPISLAPMMNKWYSAYKAVNRYVHWEKITQRMTGFLELDTPPTVN